MCLGVPTMVPWCFWGESLWTSYFLASVLRYTITLNVTWLVNGAAHMYGNRPYDKHISPRQNLLIALGTIGEPGSESRWEVRQLRFSWLSSGFLESVKRGSGWELVG